VVYLAVNLARTVLSLKLVQCYTLPQLTYLVSIDVYVNCTCHDGMACLSCSLRPVKNDVGLKVLCECIKSKYWINFKDTMVLVRMTCYVDCLVEEAIEIQLHPNNFNRDMGFSK
jgi:hypothetical protein